MKVFIENVSVGIFFIECLPLYPVPYVLFLLTRVHFFTGVSLEPELEPEQEPELRQRCCKTRSKSCPKFGWLRNPSATTTKKCRSSAPGLLSNPMFGRFRLRVLQRLRLQLQTDSSRKETQKIPKNNSQVHCNILNCLNLIAWVRTLHP